MRTFQTIIRYQNLKKELLNAKVYLGEKRSRSGFHPYAYSHHQGFSLVDLDIPSLHLDRAYQLLRMALQQNQFICFIGHPVARQTDWSSLLQKYKQPHLPSNRWVAGVLTRQRTPKRTPSDYFLHNQASIVVIFNIAENEAAKSEAMRTQKLIVGFGATTKELEGIDYPIPLPLFSTLGGEFYMSFLKNLFKEIKKTKD